MSPSNVFENQPYYLIDENLSVYRLKDTLTGPWRYWQDHVNLRPGVVVGGGSEKPIPITPDGRLVPGQFYSASTAGTGTFYFPTYKLHEEAGRFGVRLKWNADQEPDGPIAFLTVDLDAVAPTIPPDTLMVMPLLEIEHQAVVRLGYRLQVQGAPPPTGVAAFSGDWRNIDANTNGMTHVIITPQNNGGAILHGFGKCSPNDCDWGETSAQLDAGRLVGTYNFDFKTTRIVLWFEGGQMHAELFHHFTDNSGRPDRLERCELAGGAPATEQSSPLWITLGALQTQASGVRRCVLALHAKAEFDRLYSVMSDPAFGGFLEVRCFATAGRRTWRQIVVGELDTNRQVQALVETKSLYTDLLDSTAIQFSQANLNLGNMINRPLKILVDDDPRKLSWNDSIVLVNEHSTVLDAFNPGENMTIIAAPLRAAVVTGVHEAIHPPEGEIIGGGIDTTVLQPPGPEFVVSGPTNMIDLAASSVHAASMLSHAVQRTATTSVLNAARTHTVLANSRLFSSTRLFERLNRDLEGVVLRPVEVHPIDDQVIRPGEVAATVVSSQLRPILSDAFRKPIKQLMTDPSLRVAIDGRQIAICPPRAIIDESGEPALISVSVESVQEVRPFHFSVETNAYIFDLPGDLRPDRSPVLLRMDVLDDDGEVLGVFYQDSSQPDQFYYQPQEFRLARQESSPYLPEMRIVFYNLITQAEDQPENEATLEYRVEMAYRALPYIEPNVLALARQQAPSTKPRFTVLLPESSTLILRLPSADGQGDPVEVQRNTAQVHFDLGVIDEVELSREQFERIFAAFRAPSGDGLEGAVQAALSGQARTNIPVRLSLKRTAGEVLASTYKGPQGGGLHRIELLNRIESPVTIEGLYTVWLAPGVSAHPQSSPGAVLAPDATLNIDYLTHPPDAVVSDINPALSASVQVDPEKLWPDLFENAGYAGDTYTITVQTEPAFFGVTPPEAPGPLAALQIEFDAGPSVTLSAATLQATATLRFPLLDRLLQLPDARRYRFRVTNLHTRGETLEPGKQSDWRQEVGGGDLQVQPAGA